MSKTGDRAMTMAGKLARENTHLTIALQALLDAAKDVLEDIDWTAFNPPPSEVKDLAAAVAEATSALRNRKERRRA